VNGIQQNPAEGESNPAPGKLFRSQEAKDPDPGFLASE